MEAGGEASLNLLCFLILAPHPSCHLAFPLLFVGAAGDEGDPVLARPFHHSAGARDGEDRITWRCATIRPVSSLLRAASPTILLRGGASEREGRERGFGNLLGDFGPPWTESTEFGLGVDEGYLTPIKNLPSRWERMRKA